MRSVHWMSESSFEEVLSRDGKLVYTNVGDSMLPLIREGRDLLVIQPVNHRLGRYDIPLYRRDSGQYVLHRVLKVRPTDYVLCGDNRWQKETGIRDDQILGVLSSVIRNGKELSMQGLACRIYAHLWCDLFPLRALILRAGYLFRRSLSSPGRRKIHHGRS